MTAQNYPTKVGIMRFDDQTFEAPEIEKATGMPERTFELLKREKLLPSPISKPGRGRVAKYDFNGLGRFSTIMAFSQVVDGIVPAARMANGIVPELEQVYGLIPFGMPELSRQLRKSTGIWNSDGGLMPFAIYREAVKLGIIEAEKAISNDYRLLIADGEFIFQTRTEKVGFLPQFDGDTGELSPLFRLQKYGRSGGFRIEHIDFDNIPTAQFYNQRLEHAISLVHLNLSLSLRKTMNAIIESRALRVLQNEELRVSISEGSASGPTTKSKPPRHDNCIFSAWRPGVACWH